MKHLVIRGKIPFHKDLTMVNASVEYSWINEKHFSILLCKWTLKACSKITLRLD